MHERRAREWMDEEKENTKRILDLGVGTLARAESLWHRAERDDVLKRWSMPPRGSFCMLNLVGLPSHV